jgi:peptidoglycan hydrolase FlgJ
MNKLGDIGNYHDLQGLQQLKVAAKADPEDKQALKMAAQHFESIFIGMMLKSMRKANEVFEEGNPMNSNTTKFFRDMYDQQLSTDMASQGSMGLADIIVEQLAGDSPNYRPADVLRNDGSLEMARENARKVFEGKQAELNLTQERTNLAPGTAATINAASSLNVIEQHNAAAQFNAVSGLNVAPVNTKPQTEQATSKSQAISFESPKAFVDTVWQYAKSVAPKIGVNPAVMVAQSALETGWGKHILKDQDGESSFNLFNIKALRDWQGDSAAHSTLEFEDGLPVKKVEPFRVYGSFKESFDDFAQFLKTNSRYERALEKSEEPEQFLHELQKAGYATDPNYADKIMRILNSDTFKSVIGDSAPMSAGE